MHSRDVAKMGVMVAVGIVAFAIGGYVLLSAGAAIGQGLFGGLLGLGLFLFGGALVVVAVLFFFGTGADFVYHLRRKRGE